MGLITAMLLLACGGCAEQERTVAVATAGNYVCLQSSLDRVECELYEAGVASPTKEQPSEFYTQVRGGRWFVCGLRSDGEIECWGSASFNKTEPIPDGPFVTLRVGMSFGCGLRSDNTAACWGTRSDDLNAVLDPEMAWRSLGTGDAAICGIPDATGTLSCWGRDWHGEGALVPPEGEWAEVWGGADYFAARKADGTFAMWGNNQDGQLNFPSDLEFVDLGLGFDSACALTPDGEAVCWGSNALGQLDVPEGETFVDIDTRGRFACGLTPDHQVRCWGCWSDKLYDEGHPWCKDPVPSWDQ